MMGIFPGLKLLDQEHHKGNVSLLMRGKTLDIKIKRIIQQGREWDMNSQIFKNILSLALDRSMRICLYPHIPYLPIVSNEYDWHFVFSTYIPIELHLFIIHVGGNNKTELVERTLLTNLGN